MGYRRRYHSRPSRRSVQSTRGMKKMTLVALATIPIGPAIAVFLLTYGYSSSTAHRLVACWLLSVALPFWALSSTVLNVVSVFRERSMRRTTMISIACVPAAIAFFVFVPIAGLSEVGSSALSWMFVVSTPLFVLVLLLVLVSLVREPSKTGKLLIVGGIALWVVLAVVLFRLYGESSYRF